MHTLWLVNKESDHRQGSAYSRAQRRKFRKQRRIEFRLNMPQLSFAHTDIWKLEQGPWPKAQTKIKSRAYPHPALLDACHCPRAGLYFWPDSKTKQTGLQHSPSQEH
jgi:hypothetical protein